MKNGFLNIPLSVLDLAIINEGTGPADAFRRSLDLAQMTEAMGYRRFWVAEHHNMDSVASSATVVLMGYLAAGTERIRIGSGGIMLPNHAPLIVAEQIGTLESMYPGRIDLGLGRAPGTDPRTAYALRRREQSAYYFPHEVQEIQQYFSADNRKNPVRAIPGEGLDIPIWILGSSPDSARLASTLGLPYSFASHFAPRYLHDARILYRNEFDESVSGKPSYFMPCINVIAADTDEEAQLLATSAQKLFMGIITGSRAPLPPPDPGFVIPATAAKALEDMTRHTFVGSPETIKKSIGEFVEETGADELIVVSHIYDHRARIRSYEILKALQSGES